MSRGLKDNWCNMRMGFVHEQGFQRQLVQYEEEFCL